MNTFRDFLGNEIEEGDYVVYATTSGRSPVQKLAVVVKITPYEDTRIVTYNPRVTEAYTAFKVGVKEIKNGRNFTRFDSYDLVKTEDGKYIRVPKEVRTTYPMTANIVKAYH